MKPILYGLRASGKTTVGTAIAEKCNITCTDLDQEIVDQLTEDFGVHTSINTYVQDMCDGDWEGFRSMESEKLSQILEGKSQIISLGGGTVASKDNRKIIKTSPAFKIFLDITIQAQLRRLESADITGNENRPDLGKDLEEVRNERIGIYRDFADYTIKVDGRTVQQIVDEILGIPDVQQALKKAA